MLVYRLCVARYIELDGEGARKYGGRWNSAGRPAVYTSTSLSLAALEYLVHVDFDNLPVDLRWFLIEIPDGSVEVFTDPVAPNERASAEYGDDWLDGNRTLSLLVPSAVLPVERNLILNARHVEMAKVQILEVHDFKFDDRLTNR